MPAGQRGGRGAVVEAVLGDEDVREPGRAVAEAAVEGQHPPRLGQPGRARAGAGVAPGDEAGLDDQLGLAAEPGGVPQDDVGEPPRLERPDVGGHAVGDRGVVGQLRQVAQHPLVVGRLGPGLPGERGLHVRHLPGPA